MKEIPTNLSGVELIAIERARHYTGERWTQENDDQKTGGELARAAACYAISAHNLPSGEHFHNVREIKKFWARAICTLWPFSDYWFKPKSSLRDLVRAGALLAAEIDRIQRKRANGVTECPKCKRGKHEFKLSQPDEMTMRIECPCGWSMEKQIGE